MFMTESIRKLNNFNFQWTETLNQNNLKNVKFHKNCENTGESQKISCVRCNFVKFDSHFLGLP